MELHGDNPHSLSLKLQKPALQSQLHRFLSGKAREPRRTTLQPVADHYEIPVEAFYDPGVAHQVLGEYSQSRDRNDPGTAAAPRRPSLQNALAVVLDAMAAVRDREYLRDVLSLLIRKDSPEHRALFAALLTQAEPGGVAEKVLAAAPQFETRDVIPEANKTR